QAEDGIRDRNVTGVQTCALPISTRRSSLERLHRLLSSFDYETPRLSLSELSRRAGLPLSTTHRMVGELLDLGILERDENEALCKIGRASCRERGEGSRQNRGVER